MSQAIRFPFEHLEREFIGELSVHLETIGTKLTDALNNVLFWDNIKTIFARDKGFIL